MEICQVQFSHNNMVDGFSIYLRNSDSHFAPTAPSTTLWSQLNVTDIIVASENLQYIILIIINTLFSEGNS